MMIVPKQDQDQNSYDNIANARRIIEQDLTEAFEVDSQGRTIYLGKSSPGTLKTEAGWKIKKITYSGFSVTDIQWAEGNNNYDKVWNDRASYSYS